MFKRSEQEVEREGHVAHPPRVEFAPPPLPKGVSSSDANLSVLPRGAKLEGTLRTPNTLRIDGEFVGSITAAGDAILTPGSRVEANIQAQNVIVGGHHRGSLIAQNRATLGDAARVVGTITCRGLVITEGAWFEGKLSMGPPPESPERRDGKIDKGN